jgi:hypothetical protein
MLMVIPNEGKAYWLDTALGVSPPEDLIVRLYNNNYTPVDASTAVSFSNATFAGSGPFTVLSTDWAPSAIVADVAEAEATPHPQWTHGGGAAELVYGWYALTSITGLVACAQRFDAARNMTSGSVESLDPFKLKLKTFV